MGVSLPKVEALVWAIIEGEDPPADVNDDERAVAVAILEGTVDRLDAHTARIAELYRRARFFDPPPRARHLRRIP